jgi:hypothetical protein
MSVAGVGANEAAVDTEPVYRAAIKVGGRNVYTNGSGVTVVTVRRAGRITVTAGDTLRPTSAYLRR